LNASLPPVIRAAGVIRVLTDPEFEPISYYRPGSKTAIIGSDPDILRAMGKVLGVRIQFVPVAFAGMLTGIQSGRGDVAGGGLTDTTARESVVSFVDDFSLGELYVVKAGNHAGISSSPLSACGHVVAYTIGAVSATAVPALGKKCVSAGKRDIHQIGMSSVNEVLLAVRSGRADVTMYDDIGFAAVNKANNDALKAFRISPYANQYWGFAVKPGDTQLANALLAALRVVVANGAYQRILARYGVSSDALDGPGINLQSSRPQG
jgi:polar amino acid transport system substrate-binding protein